MVFQEVEFQRSSFLLSVGQGCFRGSAHLTSHSINVVLTSCRVVMRWERRREHRGRGGQSGLFAAFLAYVSASAVPALFPLLLLHAAPSASGLSTSGHSLRFGRQPTDLKPACTCACCVAAVLQSKSQVTGENKKGCAPPPESSGRKCVDFCKAKDSILSTARANEAGERVVDYPRFCAMECQPECGSKTPADEDPDYMHTCKVLKPKQVQEAKVLDGNGVEVHADGCSDTVNKPGTGQPAPNPSATTPAGVPSDPNVENRFLVKHGKQL